MQLNAGKFQTPSYQQYTNMIDTQTRYFGPGGIQISSDLSIDMSSDVSFQVRFVRKYCWMDPSNLHNKRKVNYDGPLEDLCSQPLRPLLPALVGTQYKINSGTRSNATKEIVSMECISHQERPKELRTLSLERRWEKCAVIQIWKIQEGLVLWH